MAKVNQQEILEEIEKVTTPIYRAPEQIDLYKGARIGCPVDIWALGCVMFTLMYHRPPFQEGEKLAQVNANFKIPNHVNYSPGCIRFMQSML